MLQTPISLAFQNHFEGYFNQQTVIIQKKGLQSIKLHVHVRDREREIERDTERYREIERDRET